ncbi:unnamed protein product, partial [Onchocerca flexuosa]|uniref:AAA_lid_3 domain-containing protein n=1 Tax=Onchocerca flexuosa TaxID=387005 RepID=A0A183HWP9_9BILA
EFFFSLHRPKCAGKARNFTFSLLQTFRNVLKIHASKITKHGDIDYEAIVKLSDGFSGADLRNVCTEAGLFAIRAEREYVIDEDFMKAVRKVGDAKRLETKLDYKPV